MKHQKTLRSACVIVLGIFLMTHSAGTTMALQGKLADKNGDGKVDWHDADVNGDGKVSIIDVCAVAQRVGNERLYDIRYDMDANGVIDSTDLDIMAALPPSDICEWTGLMWWVSDWWMSLQGVEGVRPYYQHAEELHVKVNHLSCMVRAGQVYTPEENFLCFPDTEKTPMSRSLIKGFIALAREYGMKSVVYFPLWCDTTLAISKYPDCILYNGGHPVKYFFSDVQQTYCMHLDPGKPFGANCLEQIKGLFDDWGFDGVEFDGVLLDAFVRDSDTGTWLENPSPLHRGMIAFLTQAKAIAESRGKFVVGNAPRTVESAARCHVIMNHSDKLTYWDDVTPWYQYLREKLHCTQLIYPAWTPMENGDFSRDTLQQFLEYCLEGAVLPTIRWNSDIDRYYANRDLCDEYIPQIIAKLTT
jgi:hypothetical protein